MHGKRDFMNKFKVVVPSYNNERWAEINLESIINQSYKNYEVFYINDASTDKTVEKYNELVGKNPQFHLLENEVNMKRGFNVSNKNIKQFIDSDDDIVVFVDGDDWLPYDDIFEKLNNFYNKHDVWMTYGGMLCWQGGTDVVQANPQNTHYPDEVHNQNAYRKDVWRASHLRSFKWSLYKNIEQSSQIDSETGKYYFHAEDLATSFPCLEMCPKEKIGVLDFPAYMFNAEDSNRQRGVERENDAGMRLEIEIRNEKPYSQLNYVNKIEPLLMGGLGNMMFQVANCLALCIENGGELVSNMSHRGTIHGLPDTYKDNVFRNLKKDNKKRDVIFEEKEFTYSKVPKISSDGIVSGYYQTEKYFKNYSKDVREFFSATKEINDYINNKYDLKNTVGIHVRRGSYLYMSDSHAVLGTEYYKKAMLMFEGYKFIIASDDTEWCKENLGRIHTFTEEEDYIDMYILSMCDHNIIGNSTFSWWSAWLRGHGRVIAPKKWFGPKNAHISTEDLYPSTWELM